MAMLQSIEPKTTEAAMQEFIVRLAKLNEDMGITTDRLQRVIDRAFGPAPETASGGQPRAVPSGAIGTIRDKLEDLAHLASAQYSLLNRLDTVV
jgi:hypothetical protein